MSEEPEPRSRGQLQDLVIAALASYHARGDRDGYKPGLALRTSAEITEMVNVYRSGLPVSRKVVLTVLRRLDGQGRVERHGSKPPYGYALVRDKRRLGEELDRLEVEYGPVAQAAFVQRAKRKSE